MRNYKYDAKVVGQRLKDIRRNADNSMTQVDFAAEIGVSLATIGKIEQGVQSPSLEILYSYMNYFDVDANQLLCDEESAVVSQLMRLSPNVRNYLQGIFEEMINRYPKL